MRGTGASQGTEYQDLLAIQGIGLGYALRGDRGNSQQRGHAKTLNGDQRQQQCPGANGQSMIFSKAEPAYGFVLGMFE